MNHTSHDVSLTVSKIIKRIPGCAVIFHWFDVKRHASISTMIDSLCKHTDNGITHTKSVLCEQSVSLGYSGGKECVKYPLR